MIDSGVGLPIGQKISLKSFIQVDDENGGFITLQYKTLNFDKNIENSNKKANEFLSNPIIGFDQME